MWLVVGAGLSGAVLAERIATKWNKQVLIIDKRDHIGGNCYDYKDPETGILMNKYGAHLFHTNNDKVWEYINQFDTWKRWEHKVLSYVDSQFVPVPVNITTVNMLLNENIQNSQEMNQLLEKIQQKPSDGVIENSEQMAVSRVGRELYEKMFKPYTIKQWNRDPSELDASVLARIPVRDDFDVRYFADKYQALPANGYTSFFEKLLNNDLINIKLNCDLFSESGRKFLDDPNVEGVIYTGPIDQFFTNYGKQFSELNDLEELEYRSIDFKITRFKNIGYYQPNSVVNYPEQEYPYTRIIEYKHFLNQQSKDTVIVSETTNDHGDPYYPIPNTRNLELYEKYRQMAEKLENNKGQGIENGKNIYFVGRLATYKYYNMDAAIDAALKMFDKLNKNKE
tara:strand:+ start:1880 stop:3064 length:1185 start_codon:yes stop_codon:yes gene_type:complete